MSWPERLVLGAAVASFVAAYVHLGSLIAGRR